jgi:hypothetical protein
MKNACHAAAISRSKNPPADEIFPVCYWHDDGQTEAKAAEVWGGPNGTLDLLEARANFRKFGAVEKRFVPHVRSPRPEELHV